MVRLCTSYSPILGYQLLQLAFFLTLFSEPSSCSLLEHPGFGEFRAVSACEGSKEGNLSLVIGYHGVGYECIRPCTEAVQVSSRGDCSDSHKARRTVRRLGVSPSLTVATTVAVLDWPPHCQHSPGSGHRTGTFARNVWLVLLRKIHRVS
jgi:hypothetical protein